MRNYLLIALILCSTTLTFSQKQGYFGKKTVISIDGSLRGSLFYKWFSGGNAYNVKTANGQTSNRFFAGGFTASMSHYFTNSVGVGVDYSMTFNYLRMPNERKTTHYVPGYYDGGDGKITIESLRMSTYYVVPKFEWASNGNLPVGVCFSIGLGYAHSKILGDDLQVRYSDYISDVTYSKSEVNTTYSTVFYRPLHGVVFEYGVKLRVPVTKFMTFNVGSNMRFHMPHFPYISFDKQVYSSVEETVRQSMRFSRGLNLVDVRAGLSFILF